MEAARTGWMHEDARLTDDEEVLLHGRCHCLAIALHRLTGLPLAGYYDVGEDDEGSMVLVHAFVVDGEDGIDVRGRNPLENMIKDEFDTWESWIAETNEVDLALISTGSDALDENDEWTIKGIAAAERLIDRLGLPRIERPAP